MLFYFFVAIRKGQQREESSDTDGKISYGQLKMLTNKPKNLYYVILYHYTYSREEYNVLCDCKVAKSAVITPFTYVRIWLHTYIATYMYAYLDNKYQASYMYRYVAS